MSDDRAVVERLLGRPPQGPFEVVRRSADGTPTVIRNAPFLDDGTPMPTRYWLVDPELTRRVSTLEAMGGVRRAEAALDPVAVAEAHRRYAHQRDADIPAGHAGPRPSGGVGGTRQGVKCLHAHLAWHLAGGDDPVGRWVVEHLQPSAVLRLTPHPDRLDAEIAGRLISLPIGLDALVAALAGGDPPRPEDLTNTIGLVIDHLDDLVRAEPQALDAPVELHGPAAATLAAVEAGSPVTGPSELSRDAAEEVFRVLATESVADRRHNPGLPAEEVGSIVAVCCLTVAILRALRLDRLRLHG